MLKNKAKLVNFPLSVNDYNVIKEMKIDIYKKGGAGLAAPQINVGKSIIAI